MSGAGDREEFFRFRRGVKDRLAVFKRDNFVALAVQHEQGNFDPAYFVPHIILRL